MYRRIIILVWSCVFYDLHIAREGAISPVFVLIIDWGFYFLAPTKELPSATELPAVLSPELASRELTWTALIVFFTLQ